MAENKLFWIGKGVFGIKKNAIKYGQEFPVKNVSEKLLKKLIKEKKIGQIKTAIVNDSAKEVEELKKQLSDSAKEVEELKKQLEQGKVNKK